MTETMTIAPVEKTVHVACTRSGHSRCSPGRSARGGRSRRTRFIRARCGRSSGRSAKAVRSTRSRPGARSRTGPPSPRGRRPTGSHDRVARRSRGGGRDRGRGAVHGGRRRDARRSRAPGLGAARRAPAPSEARGYGSERLGDGDRVRCVAPARGFTLTGRSGNPEAEASHRQRLGTVLSHAGVDRLGRRSVGSSDRTSSGRRRGAKTSSVSSSSAWRPPAQPEDVLGAQLLPREAGPRLERRRADEVVLLPLAVPQPADEGNDVEACPDAGPSRPTPALSPPRARA